MSRCVAFSDQKHASLSLIPIVLLLLLTSFLATPAVAQQPTGAGGDDAVEEEEAGAGAQAEEAEGEEEEEAPPLDEPPAAEERCDIKTDPEAYCAVKLGEEDALCDPQTGTCILPSRDPQQGEASPGGDDAEEVGPVPGVPAPGPSQVGDGEETGDPQQGADEPKGVSPIAELAEQEGIKPLEDIEEEDLGNLIPSKVYPWIHWDGQFRLRSVFASGWDLGTGGTSAIRPPAEAYLPNEPAGARAADPEASTLWSQDLRLKLEPTIHLLEVARIHVEADLLDNVVLGALPYNGRLLAQDAYFRPDPSRGVATSGQLSPREREWYENALRVQEVFGELSYALATLRVGRMDWHWGLGMFANDGDPRRPERDPRYPMRHLRQRIQCLDCDFGDNVDRFSLEVQLWQVYLMAAIDFPDEGPTSQTPLQPQAQPYDLSQVDDVDQYTFSVSFDPQTREEQATQQIMLQDQRQPVLGGGLLFVMRDQEGAFVPGAVEADGEVDPLARSALVYRGLDLYTLDAYFRFLYAPSDDLFIRLELEAVGHVGSVDNLTNLPVGLLDENVDARVNCFNEDAQGRPECRQDADGDDLSQDIRQLGVALESEFWTGGPISFGLNAGFASGGSQANWGYPLGGNPTDLRAGLDFFRFDPNYHIDLILFRNVIGTVTNAYYAKPHVTVMIGEGTGDLDLQIDVDAILSRAVDLQGTPAGPEGSAWLGFELDAAVRVLVRRAFIASLEGGVLFPGDALAAVEGRRRLIRFDEQDPEEFVGLTEGPLSPSIAWTLQLKFNWLF